MTNDAIKKMAQEYEVRQKGHAVLDKVYPIEKYHAGELPNRGSLAVRFCAYGEAMFDAGFSAHAKLLSEKGGEFDYHSLIWKDAYSDKIQQRLPNDQESEDTEWTEYVEVTEAKSIIQSALHKIEQLERQLEKANDMKDFWKLYYNPADTRFKTMIDIFVTLPKEKQNKLTELTKTLKALDE